MVLASGERPSRTVGAAGAMSARRDHPLRLTHSVPPVLGTTDPAPGGTPVGQSGTPSGSPAELYLREPDLDSGVCDDIQNISARNLNSMV